MNFSAAPASRLFRTLPDGRTIFAWGIPGAQKFLIPDSEAEARLMVGVQRTIEIDGFLFLTFISLVVWPLRQDVPAALSATQDVIFLASYAYIAWVMDFLQVRRRAHHLGLRVLTGGNDSGLAAYRQSYGTGETVFYLGASAFFLGIAVIVAVVLPISRWSWIAMLLWAIPTVGWLTFLVLRL